MTITITPDEVKGYEDAMHVWFSRRIQHMAQLFSEGVCCDHDFHFKPKVDPTKLNEALRQWDIQNPEPSAMSYFFPRK